MRYLLALLLALPAAADQATIVWSLPTLWSDDSSVTPHPIAPGELQWANVYCGPVGQGPDWIQPIHITPDATGALPTAYTFEVTQRLECVVRFIAKDATGQLSLSDPTNTVIVGPNPVPALPAQDITASIVRKDTQMCTTTTRCQIVRLPGG